MRCLPLLVALAFVACSSEDTTQLDASSPNRARDAGVNDDAEVHDDAEVVDRGFADDADPIDLGFEDAGFVDIGFADMGIRDREPGDLYVRDREAPDAPHLDADVVPDTGLHPDGGACPEAHRPRPDPACPPGHDGGVCGNNVRETCRTCTGGRLRPPPLDAGPICVDRTEECDGTDLAGETCLGAGFAGGNLGCGSWCGFDTTNCRFCATNRRITVCEEASVGETDVRDVAIAAYGQELGVAWVNESGTSFARYNLNLQHVATAPCLPTGGAATVALAGTSSGWIIATATNNGISFAALDRHGGVRGQMHSTTGWDPILIERPGAGPLMVWTDGNTTQAALLNDDAVAQWQSPVFTNVIGSDYVRGTWTGQRFLVTARAQGVRIVAVELNGSVSGSSSVGSTATEYPEIAWAQNDGRLVWTDFGTGGTVNWQRLDAMGVPVGTAVAVGGRPDYFNNAPMVTIGDDSVMLLGRFTGGTGMNEGIDLLRVDGQGGQVFAPFGLERNPNHVRRHRLIKVGAEVFASWVSEGYPSRVGLAKLAP